MFGEELALLEARPEAMTLAELRHSPHTGRPRGPAGARRMLAIAVFLI
jgi:hypothetical protein